MKTTLILMLALILSACSPAAQPMPDATTPTRAELAAAATSPAVIASQTATVVKPTETAAPTRTPASTPSATPLTEPVVAARYEGVMNDGLGYRSNFISLPGGQAWETTTGGGVRIYDTHEMNLLISQDLDAIENSFSQIVGDDKYVWILFHLPNSTLDSASLFRISRTNFLVTPVELPATCTYEACQWSTILLDGEVLWLGGYDELMGIDCETLEPVAQYLYSEQAHTFLPYQVEDIDGTDDGQLWSLFCADVCYIVILDRQMLLEGAEQEAAFIYFESAWIEFLTEIDGSMWAAEGRNGNVEEQPATLYLLEETGVELTPQDGIALPEHLDIFDSYAANHTRVNNLLWLVSAGGRKLYWFDTEKRAMGGELQVYPGDEPSSTDPNIILAISYDGQSVWTSGSEILRIAIP